MNARRTMILLVALFALLSSVRVLRAEEETPSAGDKDVADLLKEIQREHDVPAIAGAIVTRQGISKFAVVGVRKRDTAIPVTLDDKWHLGSDGKAMTATLVAKMVEQGKLKWDTPLAEIFPKLQQGFHADLRGVTVLQLLSHRAGLPANLNLVKYVGDDVRQLRLRAVKQELAKPPQSKPGSKYHYSNLGYIIAGAVVEKLTDETWEKNITDQVLAPLGMESAGFGGVGTPGKIDQPWGHAANGKPVAKNGPAVDNLPVMGPAGRVHCTVQDWGKFVADHLHGGQAATSLLKKPSYVKLHTPPFGGDYALGWLVVERPWGGGKVLNHGGSNTMNYANVWVAPKRGFAVLVCINQGGGAAAKASDAAAGALIRLHTAAK